MSEFIYHLFIIYLFDARLMASFFEKRYLLSFILFMQSFQSTTRVIRFDVFADIKRNENSNKKTWKGNGMRTVMRSIKIIVCKIFEKSRSFLHKNLTEQNIMDFIFRNQRIDIL